MAFVNTRKLKQNYFLAKKKIGIGKENGDKRAHIETESEKMDARVYRTNSGVMGWSTVPTVPTVPTFSSSTKKKQKLPLR